jgi:class 3 adenylate cyclase
MTQPADPMRGTPLLGRQDEYDRVVAALRSASEGAGRILLLSGEAGVGKSRLLREAAALARAGGARSAFGVASEGAGGRPFAPIVELLRSIAAAGAADLRTVSNAAVTALSQTDDGAMSRWAQIDAVADAIRAAAEADPPVRVIGFEDLHWADASTLELLTQVFRQLEVVPVLAIGTFRPPRPDAEALLAFTDAMRQNFGSERIDLGPIGVEAAEALVRAAFGGADDAMVAAIVQRGEGHPLFLEEAARDAARAEQEGQPPPLVPAAIRELVQRRLILLPADARQVAVALAVLDAASGTARLADLLGVAPQEAVAAVDVLVAQDLVSPRGEGQFAFRHALVRDAVYESAPPSQRHELHAAAAQLIERAEGDAASASIAQHILAAGGTDAGRRAGELLAIAGVQSIGRLAYEQAAEQLTAAVALMERAGAEVMTIRAARLRLADARGLIRADDAALDAFAAVADEAAAAGDTGTEAEAAMGYERTYLATGRPRTGADARSIPLLDRALGHLEAAGPLDSLGARLLAASAQARFFAGRRTDALADADRAASVAHDSGDPAAEAAALNVRRAATWGPGEPAERLTLTRAIIDRAAAANDVGLQLEALYWQVEVLTEIGQRTDAEAAIARFGLLAERLHQPWRLWQLHCMRAMFAHLDGDTAVARAEADLGRDLARNAGNSEALLNYAAQMILIGSEADRRTAARVVTRDLAPWMTSVTRRLGLTYFLLAADERERALAIAKAAMDETPSEGERDHMWLALVTMFGESVATIGEPLWAQRMYDELTPYADRYVVNSNTVCYGSVERILGRLAAVLGLPEAEAHSRRANERNAAIGASVWIEALGTTSTRVTRTFMFTDIVKSTNLVEAMGDEAWEPLLRWHNQALGALFREFAGEEVVSTGDGFFVAFETSDAAIDCAIAIQRRLAEHRQSSGFAPQVRIGVHATQATEVERNYHGVGVHEAARIAALAEGGEILASNATAGLHATVGLPRSVVLKGIAEPVEVVALAWR